MPALITGGVAPGVHVHLNEGQISRPAPPETASTFFLVIYSTWGPVNQPTVITSYADCTRHFGGLDPNSHGMDALNIYFNRFPGTRAVVCRVVGTGAAVATATLQDRGVGGNQHNTLRIDAKHPSSAVAVRYTVEDGTIGNTFKLTVYSPTLGSMSKEVYDNLMMDAPSIARVNQQSKLVKLTNLNSANVAPTNRPVVTADTSLHGGSDDFDSLTDADFIGTDSGDAKTGLQAFNSDEWGTGQVAIPGITTDATHAALIAHAEAFKRLALLDPPLGSEKSDVVGIRSLYGTNFAALYWPYIEMLDLAGSTLHKFYAPSGAVAGACARADLEHGPHKAPANYVIPGALDVERYAGGAAQTDEGTRAYLNDNQVNVITPLPAQGIKIYGDRVMTGDNRVQMVHEIRVLNLIFYQLKRMYQGLPFGVVNGEAFFRQVRSITESYLRTLYRAGALTGDREKDAFVVICDRTNNPPEELDAQRVHVQIGVHIVASAEMIFVNVDNVPLTQDLSVLQN
ncbi:MAG: hypothetical protein AUG51_07335 [Acidobacteria bacterium 13_1_20CM_3_53_8]|nr:MAG: hypothetical protein AUG51_07335 [Acidobacteria bacterium 13_1_20CM_3_53_8]